MLERRQLRTPADRSESGCSGGSPSDNLYGRAATGLHCSGHTWHQPTRQLRLKFKPPVKEMDRVVAGTRKLLSPVHHSSKCSATLPLTAADPPLLL